VDEARFVRLEAALCRFVGAGQPVMNYVGFYTITKTRLRGPLNSSSYRATSRRNGEEKPGFHAHPGSCCVNSTYFCTGRAGRVTKWHNAASRWTKSASSPCADKRFAKRSGMNGFGARACLVGSKTTWTPKCELAFQSWPNFAVHIVLQLILLSYFPNSNLC
jgi:hypothetical protein